MAADRREGQLDRFFADNDNNFTLTQSRERAVLLSMWYQTPAYFRRSGDNRNPTNIAQALFAGDRAEVWYEIRYGSNGNQLPGIAKRRYAEAQIFGLYNDPSNVNPEEAKQVYRMLQFHRSDIKRYDDKFGNQEAIANVEYGLAGTALAVQTLIDALGPAESSLFAYLRSQYPRLANLSEDDYLSIDTHLDPGRDSAIQSVDPDHDSILYAREFVNGVELSAKNVLIGEGGDDFLTGGKGDDILIGGTGYDFYFWSDGDGNDRIIDDDRRGRIIINGQDQGNLLSGGHFTQVQGQNVWKSADGQLTLTHESPWKLLLPGGAEIDLGDTLNDGDFGIHLFAGPSVPQNPLRTFFGDKQDFDSDPSEGGIQTVDDGFGNAVRADGQNGRPDIAQADRTDVFFGSAGTDVERFTTGDGDDQVNADGVNSATSTEGGRDLIETGAGRDIVAAGAGDDWIEGGSGADILSGDAGNDVIYAGTRGTDPLTDISGAIAAGSGLGTGLQGDWLAGGAGDDILIGGADNDVLTGGEGVDLLIGGAGADNLLGDSSYVATSLTWSFTDSGGVRLFSPVVGEADPLAGAADEIYGGSGEDFIRGGRGDDVIYGEGDADDIAGESGADVIFGGEGNDSLSGDASYVAGAEHGADYIDGGAGNDQIAGEGGDDVIYGGVGDDLILGDSVTLAVAFHGGDFIDAGDGADIVNAGAGDDIVLGGEGADLLVGDAGNDVLEGGAGADTLDGGEGDDRYVADTADTIVDGAGANTIALAQGDGPESWVLQETLVGGQPAVVLALAGETQGLTITGPFQGFSFEFANGEVLSSGELVYRVATAGRHVPGTAGDDILIGRQRVVRTRYRRCVARSNLAVTKTLTDSGEGYRLQ